MASMLRLDITVHDGWRAVIRAAAKKLTARPPRRNVIEFCADFTRHVGRLAQSAPQQNAGTVITRHSLSRLRRNEQFKRFEEIKKGE
jgi:hypothetical protein